MKLRLGWVMGAMGRLYPRMTGPDVTALHGHAEDRPEEGGALGPRARGVHPSPYAPASLGSDMGQQHRFLMLKQGLKEARNFAMTARKRKHRGWSASLLCLGAPALPTLVAAP